MRGEDLVQGFPEILQQMKTVRDLGRLGRALPSAFRIGARPIPGDHLHSGVRPEPLGHRLGGPIREELHGLAAFEIHQDRAIRMPFPQRKIVHTQHPGGGQRRGWLAAEPTQQGVTADAHVPLMTEAHPSLPAQREAQGDQALGEPQRAPCPGGRDGRQPFGEDAAVTGAIAAKPLADAQLEAHAILRPGQVRQGAPIVTMDAPRRGSAQRTRGAGLRRLHAQGDLRRGVVDGTRLEAQHGRIR